MPRANSTRRHSPPTSPHRLMGSIISAPRLLAKTNHQACRDLRPSTLASIPTLTEPSSTSFTATTTPLTPPSNTTPYIPPPAINQVLATLSPLLAHIPHAVVGLAAMSIYGYRGRPPAHISIMAPHDCKQALLTWAQATNTASTTIIRLPERDTLGVATADGGIRPVRVRFFGGEWDDLRIESIRLPGGTAQVLTLASLVDVIARAWVDEGIGAMDQARMCCLADDVRWMLGRIVGLGNRVHFFDDTTCAALLTTDFWEPFCAMYPDAVGLLEAAGVPVRERDEMLAMELGLDIDDESSISSLPDSSIQSSLPDISSPERERTSLIASLRSMSTRLRRSASVHPSKRTSDRWGLLGIAIDDSRLDWDM